MTVTTTVLMAYVENVNAQVEEHSKYLTDVVQVKVDKVVTQVNLDPEVTTFKVSATPAVVSGQETKTSIPIHPKTESKEIQVPVYSVPTTVQKLVRLGVGETKQDTAGDFANNWKTVEVAVSPIIEAEYETEAEAMSVYTKILAQLHEGADIRNVAVAPVRESYHNDNSRYPSF